MFKCKCCAEKDSRIADLKDQIQYFKAQLHPEPKLRTYQLAEDINQDMVLDGGGQTEVDLKAEEDENTRIQRESDFIFSGNDESLDH